MTSDSMAAALRRVPGEVRPAPLHPAWFALIRLCRELDHGGIERLVIQDRLPMPQAKVPGE